MEAKDILEIEMSEQVKIADFKGVPSTLFLILWAQYLESKDSNGLLHDPKVIEIVESLDYDFSQYRVTSDDRIGVAVRKEIITEHIQQFALNNGEGVVVSLGCGLDTYYERFKHTSITTWYDLDLPAVIGLRRRFFAESERYRMIAKSVMDFTWMEEIPKDKKVLIVAEGLLPYFPESEVRALLTHIEKQFLDVELLIHAISPWRVRWGHRELRKASLKLGWSIKNGQEMNNWFTDLRCRDEWYVLGRYSQRRSWYMRLLALFPFFLKQSKIIHLARKSH